MVGWLRLWIDLNGGSGTFGVGLDDYFSGGFVKVDDLTDDGDGFALVQPGGEAAWEKGGADDFHGAK